MGRRVLVTGGAGFIGSHIADRLVSGGHAVAVLDDLSSGKRHQVPDAAEFFQLDITGDVGPGSTPGSRRLRSQRRAQPFSSIVATCSPSREMHASVTAPSCPPSTAISWPSGSHTRAVPSSERVRMRLPSGE